MSSSIRLVRPGSAADDICSLQPTDGRLRPNVLFARQFGGACTGTMPADIGSKEQVQGLGSTAYVADIAQGMRVLVCQGRTPQLRRDAAIALARLALAAP
jgi:hypothetical protein